MVSVLLPECTYFPRDLENSVSVVEQEGAATGEVLLLTSLLVHYGGDVFTRFCPTEAVQL